MHPVTLLLFAAALAGFWLVYRSSTRPMWRPMHTSATVEDVPDPRHRAGLLSVLALRFLNAAALVTAAGVVVAHTSGNFFDVLFVATADLVYLEGSLYHAEGVGEPEEFLTGLAILLNLVLLLGLLCRQREGPANIGFESVLMLVLYLAGFLVLTLAM